MRNLLLAGLTLAAISIGSNPSQAAVSADPGFVLDNGTTLISGGCGPRGFRGRNGVCYARGGPPPRFRGCPPGMHPTPYGCRRNF